MLIDTGLSSLSNATNEHVASKPMPHIVDLFEISAVMVWNKNHSLFFKPCLGKQKDKINHTNKQWIGLLSDSIGTSYVPSVN